MPRVSLFSPLLLFLCCLLIVAPPAAAEPISVSFSDLNLVHSQEFDLYKIVGDNTTYVGTYNTSETVIELDSAYSYQAVLKPSKWSWLDDPFTAIEGGLRTAPPILSFFLLCMIILLPATLIFRWRRA